MTNIIAFRRTNSDPKEKVIEEIEANTNDSKFYITFPEDDEGKVFFYTNFSPGMKELYAMEMVLEYMRNQVFGIEEDD